MANLVAIAYDDLGTAKSVMGSVSELVKEHSLEIDDAVIVETKQDGKIKLHQPSAAGVGAASGALWGGLIGLIFLMPLFGMAIGAAAGGGRGRGQRLRDRRQVHEGARRQAAPGSARRLRAGPRGHARQGRAGDRQVRRPRDPELALERAGDGAAGGPRRPGRVAR